MLCVDRHRVIHLVFMFIEVTNTNVVLEKETVLEIFIKNTYVIYYVIYLTFFFFL